MTKFQKQMLTIAAAGALTAVTALPAMAFENQFNGSFLVKTYVSNFDNGASSFSLGNPLARDKAKTNNYVDQRTRIQYTAKASDDLKLVTQLEMNTKWGTVASPTVPAQNTTGVGGGIDTDGLNVATRWAYLDFNMGKSVNVKVGQQPYKDQIKGLYLDADMPMAQVAYTAGGYKLNLGYARFNDTATGLTGDNYWGAKSADLFVVENTYAVNKGTKVGLAYYLNVDNTAVAGAATGTNKKINTFGLFGETQMGALNLSGFAAMQVGYQKMGTYNVNYHGWAANALAKMKVGSGLARAGFLFTSGNNNGTAVNGGRDHNRGWQTVSWQGTNNTAGQNSYVESGMMLLVRNQSMGGTNTDVYLRKPITNIALAHVGYDANITEKFYVNGNLGFAWLPASDYLYTNAATSTGAAATATATPNGSDFLGTEMNLEAGYKLYSNLTLKAQAAYLVLGGAFKNKAATVTGAAADPVNPYTLRLAASYSF